MKLEQAVKIAIADMHKVAQREYAFGANVAAKLGDKASEHAKRALKEYTLRMEAIKVLEEAVRNKQLTFF